MDEEMERFRLFEPLCLLYLETDHPSADRSRYPVHVGLRRRSDFGGITDYGASPKFRSRTDPLPWISNSILADKLRSERFPFATPAILLYLFQLPISAIAKLVTRELRRLYNIRHFNYFAPQLVRPPRRNDLDIPKLFNRVVAITPSLVEDPPLENSVYCSRVFRTPIPLCLKIKGEKFLLFVLWLVTIRNPTQLPLDSPTTRCLLLWTLLPLLRSPTNNRSPKRRSLWLKNQTMKTVLVALPCPMTPVCRS